MTLIFKSAKFRGLVQGTNFLSTPPDYAFLCTSLMNKDSVILKLLQRYSGHKSGVYALEAKPGTNILWSGSGDQIVAQWNIAEENDGMMLAKSTGIVYALKFIPQQNHLLIGQSSGGVHVINLVTNKEERLLQYHNSPVFHIAHNEQQNLIFLKQ